MNHKELIKRVKAESSYLIECRRHFHRHPELSGQEYETKAFIRAEIDKLGLPVDEAAHTAQIAILDTGRPGKHVMLRADIDALPIMESENNLAGPRAVRSENPGVMHACGHDAHTAMLLGAMKILYEMRDELSGVLYFVFEEGEETSCGIDDIMRHLAKYPIEHAWGMHTCVLLETGKIDLSPGPRQAGNAVIQAVVHGRGGHGSRPDRSINPTFAAAMMFPNTASAFENRLDVSKRVTLGLTTIEAGGVSNVFPDTATIKGSLRFFDVEEGRHAVEVLKEVFTHTAEMMGCTVTFEGTEMGQEPTYNDPHAVEVAHAAIAEVLGEDAFVPLPPSYGTESMNQYLKKYPGAFMNLGIKNEKVGSGASGHNCLYDLDEDSLWIGTLCTIRAAQAYLKD